MPSSPSPRSDPRLLRALEAMGLEADAVKALQPLAGDVGERRYYRHGKGDGSCVLALYPTTSDDACRRFLATTELLTGVGVRVPRVLAAACEDGWTWLEDLGPQTLYQRFRDAAEPWREMRPWIGTALEALDGIRTLAPEKLAELGNAPLDAPLLRRELTGTEESCLKARGLTRWADAFDDLVAEIDALPRVPCHRDFMVRNLVPLDDRSPAALGVLDHQDLRMGPAGYDLASLLNDSLFPPPEVERELLAVRAAGDDQRLAYHRLAAQRTLKAAGTFARTGHHRELIEATLARARAHLTHLPEAMDLLD